MRLVMLKEMKLEIARAKTFAKPTRMTEHSKITVTDLRNPAVGASLEHISRNECRLDRLHSLVAKYPRFPVMADVLNILERDPGLGKAKFDRMKRKPAVMLFS